MRTDYLTGEEIEFLEIAEYEVLFITQCNDLVSKYRSEAAREFIKKLDNINQERAKQVKYEKKGSKERRKPYSDFMAAYGLHTFEILGENLKKTADYLNVDRDVLRKLIREAKGNTDSSKLSHRNDVVRDAGLINEHMVTLRKISKNKDKMFKTTEEGREKIKKYNLSLYEMYDEACSLSEKNAAIKREEIMKQLR